MRWTLCRIAVLALALGGSLLEEPRAARAQDTAGAVVEFRRSLAKLDAATREQDSLLALAASAVGTERMLRTEQIWDRQSLVESLLLEMADHVRRQQAQGHDVSEQRRMLGEELHRGWPRYQGLLRDVASDLDSLRRGRTAASGAQRVLFESRMTEISDRQSGHYRSLVNTLQALERAGVDVAEERRFVIQQLLSAADVLVTRLRLIERERVSTAARVARSPGEEGPRQDLSALDESRRRTIDNLSLAIELLDRFGVETDRLKVSLITTSGRMTADVFDPGVIGGLLQNARTQLLDVLATRAPIWLLRALIIALLIGFFWLLASLVRRLVRRAVSRTQFSHLLRETLVAGSWHAVMGIGVIIVLTQLGVQVGALFTGLGIAGFVVGFAMQDSLSNFAAGAMILAYRPFDLGDDIEAGTANGKVKAMSLVATTIVTPDNQTLIVPNRKIWGDVIRNTTAQPTRRVDLTFSAGYVDDLDKAERVLNEILASDEKVLRDPPAVVRMHQLADGGVNFVVRPWTRRDHYWDVYWGITREVKRRFDEEGISFPGARRELYLHTLPPEGTAPERAGVERP